MEIVNVDKLKLDRYRTFIIRYAKALNIDYDPLNHTVKKEEHIKTIEDLADRAAELEFGKVLNKKINDESKILR